MKDDLTCRTLCGGRVDGTPEGVRSYPVLVLLVTVSLFLFSVWLPEPLVAAPRRCPQPGDSASPSGDSGSRTIDLPVNLDAVRDLQKVFENGHQPWRGDPTWVAAVAVTEALGPDSALEPASALASKLVVECEAASESVVAGKDASHEYRVYLERLLPSERGQPSIWTAVRVAVASRN